MTAWSKPSCAYGQESPSVDDAASLPNDEPCVIIVRSAVDRLSPQISLRAARNSGIGRRIGVVVAGPDPRLAALTRTHLEGGRLGSR